MNDGALLKTDVAAMRKHKGVLHARNTNKMCERKRFTNDRRVENKQKALCAHEENSHRACAKRAHNKGVLPVRTKTVSKLLQGEDYNVRLSYQDREVNAPALRKRPL